jgi:hypothetical protein
VVPGVWTGWDSGVFNAYSVNNTVSFTINNSVSILNISIVFPVFNATYFTSTTGLTIDWYNGANHYNEFLSFSAFPTIASMISYIQSFPGFNPTSTVPSENSASFKIASGPINTSADIYRALRPVTVIYQTIRDTNLIRRNADISGRPAQLNSRDTYLSGTVEPYIKSALNTEGLLRVATGAPGDLYMWADNRYNRRQGCEARLVQITQVINSNSSAQAVNQRLL